MSRLHHYLDESLDTISHVEPPSNSLNQQPLKLGYPEELPKPSPPQGQPVPTGELLAKKELDWWQIGAYVGAALSSLLLLFILIF